MEKNHILSKGEQKDLENKLAVLKQSPDDAMAASRVGYLLNKAGREEEASDHLWKAFRSFVHTGQFTMAVMVADELLSMNIKNVEIMHQLSQIADQKDIEVPVLEVYRKYKDFHRLPLFSELGEVEFLQLLKASRYHDFKKNKTVMKEGAKGDDIYLIVAGRVRVAKKTKGRKEVLLGDLNGGDFLGEMAFMSDRRRTATITADTPCQLLSWKGEAIKELNQRHPKVTQVLFQTFWERSLDTVLSLSPLFSHLDGKTRKKIIQQFETHSYSPKEIVLHQGEENPEGTLYIIKKGEVAVFSEESGGERHPLAVLKVGDIFGEYSALVNKPCTATVLARTPLEVLTLPRSAFVEIIKQDAEVAQVLEKIRKERLDDPLLQMSYFQVIHELAEEHTVSGVSDPIERE
ncbi:cyclic nucleotide-binding domain-containing protein [Thermodesulfobacteriota bacterium]